MRVLRDFIDLVENEYGIGGVCFLNAFDDSTRHGANICTTVSTDFSYDERPMGGRFWAKYDASRSDAIILVDKKSGHVIFGKIDLTADEVGALPSLKLLQGFQSAGEGHLEMTFRGDVFSREEVSGEPAK